MALISERTARDGFPGEDPIGRKISNIVPNNQHSATVVGVVADTRINGLKDTAAMVYMPYWAYTPWTISFLVRSSQGSDELIPEIRRTIWSIDPQVAIPSLKSMDTQVEESVAADRFQTFVLTSFGIAALLLALLGVYGVMAYSVSLRQREFADSYCARLRQSCTHEAGFVSGRVSSFAGHERWACNCLSDATLGAQPALRDTGYGPVGYWRQFAADDRGGGFGRCYTGAASGFD